MTAVLRVAQPGLLTTLQDLGRLNAIGGGVPPGGAADRFAHRAANLLVGNAPGDATLECTVRGPELVAEAECLIAVCGADLSVAINGVDSPGWTSLVLAPGDRLSFGRRRAGLRAYIAVAGGFEGDRWLGSRSTSLIAGRGGRHGRALIAGDVLHSAGDGTAKAIAGRTLDSSLRPHYSDHVLYVMPGPHHRRLDAASRDVLAAHEFHVSRNADRMGMRLDGPTLSTTINEELLSFGLVAGAVQLPHSGHPIVLLADHQTAGGYAVVATVVSASLPVAAQLAPGDQVRFAMVTAAQAGVRRKALNEALASLAAP